MHAVYGDGEAGALGGELIGARSNAAERGRQSETGGF